MDIEMNGNMIEIVLGGSEYYDVAGSQFNMETTDPSCLSLFEMMDKNVDIMIKDIVDEDGEKTKEIVYIDTLKKFRIGTNGDLFYIEINYE